MNLDQIRAEYEDVLKSQEALVNLADTRELSDEEEKQFDDLTAKVRELTGKMEKANKLEEAKRNIAAAKFSQPKKSEEQKATESFNMLRVISELAKGKSPDQISGAEGEMHQEAVREAKEYGRSIAGYGMPSFQLRAQDAATAATAGNLIATNLDGTVIPALRPTLVMAQLGATALNGLVGDLDLPAGDGIATATWEGETDQAANTDPTTRLVELRPNRLAAITTVSKRLLVQSSIGVEQWIRGELSNAIARAVDTAAISGNGSGIDGILGTSGVNKISFAGAVSRAKLVNMITKIATQNYDAMTMNFLMNPIIKGELMNLKTDAGSGEFVMDDMNTLLGYNVATTTLVPTNIAGSKTAVIFGDFSNCIIANWGGVDILVDPFVRAEYGQVRIIINSEWDVALKQPKAFCFGDDITWTALS